MVLEKIGAEAKQPNSATDQKVCESTTSEEW